MNKRPLTITVMSFLRGAFPVAILFIAINMIRFAEAQPRSNAGTSTERSSHCQRRETFVKVHSAQRTQISSPQQSYTATRPSSPSVLYCGVESRAAHGQVAPNTNGGTLNPVAFANPTTVNASGRVAFNSQEMAQQKVCSSLIQTVQFRNRYWPWRARRWRRYDLNVR